MAEKETPEERRKRIQEEVAKASAARRENYFAEQTKAKEAAAEKLPPLPEPDAYVYQYVWRQDVGGTGGEYKLVKTQNPYYDASKNEIVDPVTGERKPMVPSMVGGKTVKTSVKNSDGTTTITYTDGTTKIIPASNDSGSVYSGNGTAESPFTKDGKPFTGTYNGNNYVSGVITKVTTNPIITTDGNLTADQSKSLSAFEVFRGFLSQYGLEGLASDVEKYKLDGLSDEELLIKLRTESTAYKNRFKANEARIAKGLRALSEAEYIGLEDKYQDVMRRYGLPETYYTRGEMGRQEGFEKLIANDISNIELEDRIQNAQQRVINAAPQIKDALKTFYGDEVTNGDILAYVLDPKNAIEGIKRKITAAEIGGAAVQSGLATGKSRAEELMAYGVTGEQARQGYQTIADVLPTASKLGDIYSKQGLGPYTQTTAEQEVFGTAGATQAAQKRRKLAQLETAQFSGSSGAAGGALARERAGQF